MYLVFDVLYSYLATSVLEVPYSKLNAGHREIATPPIISRAKDVFGWRPGTRQPETGRLVRRVSGSAVVANRAF